MKAPLLIGLSGKAGSGKSTVADHLSGKGYYSLAFADVLKEVVGTAFGFTAEQLHGGLKEAIDPRFHKSPRWCLQHFGSAFREVWPQIWIMALLDNISLFWAEYGPRLIVITDVRQ